jgi:hypothetical protein
VAMLEGTMARVGTRTILAGVVGLLAGCIIGWMVLGWVIFPVTWTNADPVDLRPEQKEAYIQLVADSFSINSDGDLARERLVGFDRGELGDTIARMMEEREKAGDTEGKRNLQYLAMTLDLTPSAATPGAEPAEETGGAGISSQIRSLLPICGLGVVLLLIVGLIAVIVFRVLQQRTARVPGERLEEEFVGGEELEGAALGRFVTSYQFGDDGYDTSFNVETHGADGEFYGACGVGFSEVLGEGSPDKIAAFEAWIFDKTDMDNVQTVTKVLMSEFAYNSEVLRAKMKDRGEAILAEKGKTLVIEGVGLELRAEIVDLAYGADPSLPPNSYFETLTTQLIPAFKS